MRIILFFSTLAMLLFIAIPASAEEAQDFINQEAADWIEIAESNGYNVLCSDIGMIENNDITWTYDLAPGVYHFYTSGGMHISDLDLFITGPDGEDLASDVLADKIPVIVLYIDERIELNVKFTAWSYEPGFSTGYFCIVLACEGEGEILEFTGDATPAEPPPPGEDVDTVADSFMIEIAEFPGLWTQIEEDAGNTVIDCDIVTIDAEAYELTYTLEEGFYEVYAQSDSRCLDLDIMVYDENMNPISEDQLSDNFPICEFLVPKEQEISINLEVFEYDEGCDGTYVSYMIAFSDDVSDDSRSAYIDEKFGMLRASADELGDEIIDSGIDVIGERDSIVLFESELDKGSYYCEARGGMAVTDLDIFVYDKNGDLLTEDTYDNNYPLGWFDIDEPGMVKVELTAVKIVEGFDEGYYCWILTTAESQDGMG